MFIEEWNGLEAAQQLSDYLRAKGCFTTYNHPIWSRVDIEEVVSLQNFWAVEVYKFETKK